MPKTLTSIKQHLSTLRDIYAIPSESDRQVTRTEIRRIVRTVSFSSNVPQMHYEDLESAVRLMSK